MYEAARRAVGGRAPLTLVAARRLTEAVRPGDVVFLTAGNILPPWNVMESDGPPGAAVLARAVSTALDAVPVLPMEDAWIPAMEVACRAVGLNPVAAEHVREAPPPCAAVVGFPLTAEEGQRRAVDLLDTFAPTALIAVERAGCNEKGEYHSGRGYNITALTGKFHYLFREAIARGILTIGIGDHGGELGLGKIRETVKRYVLTGERCACPCGGGIADAVDADIPLVAGISNWGAYGLVAMLAALTGRLQALHTGEQERRLLAACADAGVIEGFSGKPIPGVDGVPPENSAAFVELLRMTVERGLDRSFTAYV